MKIIEFSQIFLTISVLICFAIQNCKEFRSSPGYFKVRANSGLILREKPTRESNKILTLPKHTTGEIIEETKIRENINGRKGDWLKVKHNERIGYIFSGYASISKDLATFQDENDFDFHLNEIPKIESGNYETLKSDRYTLTLKSERTKEINQFFSATEKIYTGSDYKNETFGRIVFTSKSGQLFAELSAYDDTFSKQKGSISQIFYADRFYCHACCDASGYPKAYLTTETKIFSTNAHLTQRDGICHSESLEGPFGDWSETKVELKNNQDKNRLLVLISQPDCEDFFAKVTEKERDALKTFIPDKFKENIFLVFQFHKDNIEFKKYFNKSIPSDFFDEWNSLQYSLEEN